MGHCLQHVEGLQWSQNTLVSSQRETRTKVDQVEDKAARLESDVKALRAELSRLQQKQPEADRLSRLEDTLTALKLMVYDLRVDVDTLIAHTGLLPVEKGKQQPLEAR